MSFTIQQICDLARVPLNDSSKTRYPDALLLGYANTAIMQAYKERPDFLIGTGNYEPGSALILSSAFPLPDQYAQTVADYIGGRAEMRDDEAANTGRAVSLMQLFTADLTS